MKFPLLGRIVWKSLRMRRSRVLVALIALAVAATAATAMFGVYLGLEAKLDQEFRSYGANIAILAREGQSLSPSEVSSVRQLLGTRALVVPVAYGVAHLSDGSPVVVAGTEFTQVRRLNPWWSVSRWPAASYQRLNGVQALVGVKVQRAAAIAMDSVFELSFAGKTIRVDATGSLQTGGAEDNRIYISLADFQQWTGLGISTLEVGMTGSARELNRQIAQLQHELPEVEVRPIRQILEAEGQVIRKTRSVILLSTVIVAVTVSLCVLANLTSSVLERRRDFALMKALGSSAAQIQAIFLLESTALAFTAAVFGFIAGGAISAAISKLNFHSPVWPSLGLFPFLLAGCLGIAWAASLLPLARLQEFEPAWILKGE